MANDRISIPDIKFTFLINFRQLNLLDKEKLNLRELLNICPLLNEKTLISDTLIDDIIQHPEQLFVIFDGFDEYKFQRKVYGNYESRFFNDVKTNMPVPALISKFIQKKLLANSTIMITSRPGEANDLYQRISFDQYVEITGFSESQIIEYVEKYFNSRPEEAMTEEEKKKAIDKFKGTAHYMTFGRVPLRCFLICPVIEWEIKNKSQHSASPVTITEFYHDVIHCLERHNRERFDKESSSISVSVDVTLENLSKLAGQLNQENRFSFTLEDLRKLKLTETELVHIKSSNLLYCCPVVSTKSKYRETHLEYFFAHLTIQEFLVAWHLVSENKMPPIGASDMVYTFMGGLLGRLSGKDSLMLKLLECAGKVESINSFIPIFRQRLLLLTCLYEYGQDSELTTRVLTSNLHHRFWDKSGSIELTHLTDSDCTAVAMLLNKVSAPSLSVAPPVTLNISSSTLTCSNLNAFLPFLTAPTCTINKLELWGCHLDDQCAYCLGQHLPKTKITKLRLSLNDITDVGVEYLVNQCPSTCMNLTQIDLSINKISDASVMHLLNHCPSLTVLKLECNKITDIGVEHITNHCPTNLRKLELNYNKITDIGVKHLTDNCPSNLTEINLGANDITDDGLTYIVNHRPLNLKRLQLYSTAISSECIKWSLQFCKDNYPDFSLYSTVFRCVVDIDSSDYEDVVYEELHSGDDMQEEF